MFYRTINDALKEQFGKKVVKLSIDGGFTCPNRDGSKGFGGCSFCSSSGSGEFSGNKTHTIHEQMEEQRFRLRSKWNDTKYIAYFQNFTNTYADVETLRSKYDEALRFPNVVGLAIATRPDCLSDSVLSLLSEYNARTYLWLELGIQTACDRTARLINRGYLKHELDLALRRLRQLDIRTVAHIIIGLPGETRSDWFNTLDYLVSRGIWGLKIHMLNILKGTRLASDYQRIPFPLPERDEYIRLICDILETLPKELVIHRLTGDGPKDDLIAPQWVKDKRAVLNGIQKELRRRESAKPEITNLRSADPRSAKTESAKYESAYPQSANHEITGKVL